VTRLAAFSTAAGIGSALALRSPTSLADPISCPGLFEFLAVIASRTWRDVPLGSMLTAGNAVVTFAALLLLARAVHRVASSSGIAVAVTLAAALSFVFAPALAPSAGAAFLVATAAWGVVLRTTESGQPGDFPVGAVAVLALAAAIVTPLMVPAGLVAGWLTRKRSRHAVLAVAIVFSSCLAVQAAVPHGPSLSGSSFSACILPDAPALSLIAASRAMFASISANPLVAALAALGIISIGRLTNQVVMSVIVLTVASLWATMVVPEQPVGAMAAFALALWLMAGRGLAEVQTGGSKVGAFVLAAVLVALQASSASARREAITPADGHHQLTLSMVGTVVGSVPRGAAIVTEDATIDLLTRALPSRLRSADRFRFVPADPETIAETLRTSRVFALPRSQRLLQQMAVELVDASSLGAAGLAEVRQVHECSAVLGGSPTSLPSIAGVRQLALVAGNEHSCTPIGWPPAAMRGLHGRIFDRSQAADERDFTEELRTYELLPWSAPPTRYVTRIELWRTPEAPLVLPLSLGGPAGAGTARRLGSNPDQDLRLCPSFPYEIRPMRPGSEDRAHLDKQRVPLG
jgi:hypothetical protein